MGRACKASQQRNVEARLWETVYALRDNQERWVVSDVFSLTPTTTEMTTVASLKVMTW